VNTIEEESDKLELWQSKKSNFNKIHNYRIIEEHFQNPIFKNFIHCKMDAESYSDAKKCEKQPIIDDLDILQQNKISLRINGEGICVGKSELLQLLLPATSDEINWIESDESTEFNIGTMGKTNIDDNNGLTITILRPANQRRECLKKYRFKADKYRESRQKDINEEIEHIIYNDIRKSESLLERTRQLPNYIIIINENDENEDIQ